MFASSQSTVVPTAAPTAAPSPLELRPYDSRTIYVFYALMFCFACMWTTILLVKLCTSVQQSECLSDCCAKVDACCCACFRKKAAPARFVPRIRDTVVIPEHEFLSHFEPSRLEFGIRPSKEAEVSTV